MKDIRDNAQFEQLLNDRRFVVVQYHAQWCGPCKMLKPTMEKVSEEERFDHVTFVRVDIDEVPEAAKRANLRGVPAVAVFKQGELLDLRIGADTQKVIGNFVFDTYAANSF